MVDSRMTMMGKETSIWVRKNMSHLFTAKAHSQAALPGYDSSPQVQVDQRATWRLWGPKREIWLQAHWNRLHWSVGLLLYKIEGATIGKLRKRVTLYTTAPYLFDLGQQIDPLQRLGWFCAVMSVGSRLHEIEKCVRERLARLKSSLNLKLVQHYKDKRELWKLKEGHIWSKVPNIPSTWGWRWATLEFMLLNNEVNSLFYTGIPKFMETYLAR